MHILRAIAFLILATFTLAAQTSSPQPLAPSDLASPPADAVKAKDGLVTKVLKPGTGTVHPGKDEVVTIDYSGWTADGKMFDSSVSRGKPTTVGLNGMPAGLAQGIQLMVVGESRRLWLPESLAFKGAEGKPKGPLVFDVTLLDMPTHAPADVKTPPADAQHTTSGIAYKVLQPGSGTRHPKRSDTVTVNYTGWTTDGKMFDSSLARGTPTSFPLDGVIAGWTEGVQLMTEGEKMRFWIPERLAYKGDHPPYGVLVFDIELIKIQ